MHFFVLQLNSLLRIVRKRVQSDKLLLSLYQTFAKSTPGDFAITDNDPIVARVVVVFKNAYDKASNKLLLAEYGILRGAFNFSCFPWRRPPKPTAVAALTIRILIAVRPIQQKVRIGNGAFIQISVKN